MCRHNHRTKLDDFREEPWLRTKYADSISDHFEARAHGLLKIPVLPIFAIYDSFCLNPLPISGPVVLPFSLVYNLGWTLGDIVCPELWVKLYPY